jgi:cyanate permease
MLTGLWVLTLASAAGSRAHGPTELLLLRAVEGFGFLLASLPAPSLIRQLVVPARMSTMLGLWGAYMPLGTALALLCGPLVMAVLGWPGWWWTLAALSAGMALWLQMAVPSDGARRQAPSSGAGHTGAVASHGWRQRLHQTLTARGPWLVALTFAMYSGQWLAVIGFLPSIYAQAGLAGGWVGVLTALAAAVNMLGNISSGRLLQSGVRPQKLLYLGFMAMSLGAWLAFGLQEAPPVIRYAGVLLFSALGGLIPGTLFSLAVHLAPSERTVSTTVGWMQQWSSIGQFAGPPVVAWVASAAGDWHLTWVVTGACCAVGVMLALEVSRTTRP